MIGFMGMRLLCAAIFLIILFKVIVSITGKVKREHTRGDRRGVMILKERFASGESDENKYREMVKVVNNS